MKSIMIAVMYDSDLEMTKRREEKKVSWKRKKVYTSKENLA